MFFKPSDYSLDAEERDQDVYSDYEPVYPDGTPKQECWNSNALNVMKSTPGQKRTSYIENDVKAENE